MVRIQDFIWILLSFVVDFCVNYYYVVDQGIHRVNLPLGKLSDSPPVDLMFLVQCHAIVTRRDVTCWTWM
jgi:hypothetical protein